MTLPLALIVLVALGTSVRAQPAPILPPDPVPVPVVSVADLRAVVLDGAALRALGYWMTLEEGTTVRTEAPGVVAQTLTFSVGSPRLELNLELGVGPAPAVPDSARSIRIDGYAGHRWSMPEDPHNWNETQLVVAVAPRRWLSVTSRSVAEAEVADAVAALVDLDALAAVREDGRAWQDARTAVTYATTADYWDVHPGIVWAQQADPRALAAALPPAPPGAARTLTLTTSDVTTRYNLSLDGSAVARDLVVPVASAEACYVANAGAGASAPPAEALALALAGLADGPEPGSALSACLRLTALSPTGDDALAEAQRRVEAAPNHVLPLDGFVLSALGFDPYADLVDVRGRPGQRTAERDLQGEVAAETMRLGPRTAATLRTWPGGDAVAAEVWAGLAAVADAGSVWVPYAVRPADRDRDYRSVPDDRFEAAAAYAYEPAEGLVARQNGRAELRRDGLALEVPVPDGWEVWTRRTRQGQALALAASQGAPLDPDAPDGVPPGAGGDGLFLFAGTAEDVSYPSPLVPHPLAALGAFDDQGTTVFGAFFRADRCRAVPAAFPDALVALALACDWPSLEALVAESADYFSIVQSIRFGSEGHVVRAVVLEHVASGAAGVLVVGPEGAGEAAEELARQTAEGMAMRHVSGPGLRARW